MAGMPFQSYMAWPVPNGTNEIRRLATELPVTLGPKLKALNDSSLRFNPAQNLIIWSSPLLKMTAPSLDVARSDGQSYLVAELFPLPQKVVPPPGELFAQFNRRDDIVYYDWETTGRRLEAWRLLTELLPIIHRMSMDEAVQERKAFEATTNSPKSERYRPPYIIADNWLAGVAAHLTGDTTTEVAKTGPAELTIKRRSPFLFTSIELELLTHWLAHAPAVGHIDPYLLPPKAKVTGPGMPSH